MIVLLYTLFLQSLFVYLKIYSKCCGDIALAILILKMNILKIFTLLIVILSVSCNIEFTKDFEIASADHENKLVINSHFIKGDSIIEVYLKSSKAVAQQAIQPELINPYVIIEFADGIERQLIYNDSTELYELSLENVQITAGDQIKLEAGAENFDVVFSSQIVPQEVNLLSAELEANAYYDIILDPWDKLTIELNEDNENDNFYAISLSHLGFRFARDSIASEWKSRIFPVLGNMYRGGFDRHVVFSDSDFNGLEIEIPFRTIFPKDSEGQLKSIRSEVILESITEERYLYLKSLAFVWQAEDNPFVDNFDLSQNIENGYGYFTISNVDRIELN